MALRSPLHFMKERIIYEECIPFARILEEKKKKQASLGTSCVQTQLYLIIMLGCMFVTWKHIFNFEHSEQKGL